MSKPPAIADDRPGTNPISAEHHGAKTHAVEPGGVGHVPGSARRGRAVNLRWTWTSPNLEFATVVVATLYAVLVRVLRSSRSLAADAA